MNQNRIDKEVSIERAQLSDWKRTRTIRLHALRDSPDAFGSTLEREQKMSDEEWQDRLRKEGHVTLIAILDGRDVGIAVGAPYEDAVGIFAMWVAPESRGKGIGDKLVDTIVQWAKKQGHESVLLDVADENKPAIKLYERNGFKPNGRTSTLPAPRTHIKEHQRVLWLR